jgi:hypothetical protein
VAIFDLYLSDMDADIHTSHQVKYVVEANKPATESDPVTERFMA